MEIDPASLDARSSFGLLTSIVCPRPTYMLSVADDNGAPVVGPFSFVNGVTSRPTVMMVAVNPARDGAKKHVCACLERRREFVLAVAIAPMIDTATHAARPATRIAAPLLADSPLQMECALHSTVEVAGGTTVILGRVLVYHIRDDAMKDGTVDPRRVPWVGQIGADSCRVTDLFERRRIPL